MPRLDELVTFCKVVEMRSFSRAADFLGLTQPAISLQIKELEKEYGVELLHRSGYETLPTEHGKTVYEAACQIINLYERSREQVRSAGQSLTGELMVGGSSGPGEFVLPLLLSKFKKRYQEVDISLIVGSSVDIIDQVLSQRIELGLVGMSRRDRHLQFETFVKDELVLIAPAEDEWRDHAPITIDEFLQLPIVLQQQGSGATALLQSALREHDISLNNLNIIAYLGLQESTKTAVRVGGGLTIISRLGVLEELKHGNFVEVPIEHLKMYRDIYFVYRRTLPLTNLVSTFIDFAHQHRSDLTDHEISA
ncbi:MAG: LysR family transcriptional regulator [Anaerolineae bacterium]|nr:LysR family transcriptional regulator [Anaerolineae bacterium]